ncbi:uncharacterized protein LOC108864625 [Galendromus occidentalis]|uniref:Uncharacterized protein LOC108864625 n=1 Tax=Galendromus occidentalis TaxID=34638 RepID=A0AAJ7PAD5_9ACAR|nr:uncharacterized protein LOC108864625 [Galendromus occidentalis]
MEKASRAIRRSGIRLKSMNPKHKELALIISGMRDIRSGLRNFQNAQTLMMQDMVVWSRTDENRAIQDVMERINELNFLWADSLQHFFETLRTFRQQCEMILEGEKVVDTARADLARAERKERKIKTNIKKISKKAPSEKMMTIEMELSNAERAKDLAHFEAVQKVQENEVCKMIRLKEGLTKLTESYIELAHKMAIVFDAQKDVVQAIPEVNDTAIHELKYMGGTSTKLAVEEAKNRIEKYRTLKFKLLPQGIAELPPPYSLGSPAPESRPTSKPEGVSYGAQGSGFEPTVPPYEEREAFEANSSSDDG